MKKKGFTLIELLTVVIIMGLVMVIAIPSVRNLTYNNSQKKYRIHEKIVHEAAKVYAKNYRGEFNNETADCSGSVILRKRSSDGYNYEYYLNCYDEAGTLMHESDPIPLACKGVNGKFKVDYVLKKDGESGQEPYTEGDWAKYIYGEYNSSSPYNLPVSYTEYSFDFINWTKMVNKKQTYTNYNGNVFVRAVDEGENVSEATRHLVRGDSEGPEFQITGNESLVLDGNEFEVSIVKSSVKDRGVGIDVNGESYSFDEGTTWGRETSTIAMAGTNKPIYAKDYLGNVSIVTSQTLHACTPTALTSGTPGTAKAEEILTGKEAWVNGKKVTGTMANQGSQKATIDPGGTYKIPKGYHDGTGTVSASSLASNTQATAGAGDILNTKTAWVSGNLVTGSMTNNHGLKKSIDPGESYTIPKGYHDGTGKVTVTTLEANTEATATAGKILKDKTAWVNGTKVTGTMANKGKLDWKPSTNTTYNVPAGYYSGGTLDSSDAYAAGHSAGYEAGMIEAAVKRVKLGSCSGSCSYSLTGYAGYQNFTANNFGVIVTGVSVRTGYWTEVGNLVNQGFGLSYTASTGSLAVNTARGGMQQHEDDWANAAIQADVSVDVYLYY